MKQLISSALLISMFFTACSSGENHSEENVPMDSSSQETLSNDSLEGKLRKAEELVKDDSTTTDENEF